MPSLQSIFPSRLFEIAQSHLCLHNRAVVDNEHTETDSFRREAKSPFDTAEDELSEVEYVMIHAIKKKEKLNQEGEC